MGHDRRYGRRGRGRGGVLWNDGANDRGGGPCRDPGRLSFECNRSDPDVLPQPFAGERGGGVEPEVEGVLSLVPIVGADRFCEVDVERRRVRCGWLAGGGTRRRGGRGVR